MSAAFQLEAKGPDYGPLVQGYSCTVVMQSRRPQTEFGSRPSFMSNLLQESETIHDFAHRALRSRLTLPREREALRRALDEGKWRRGELAHVGLALGISTPMDLLPALPEWTRSDRRNGC